MKKYRASLPSFDEDTLKRRLGGGLSGAIGEVLGSMAPAQSASGPEQFGGAIVKKEEDEDEEL